MRPIARLVVALITWLFVANVTHAAQPAPSPAAEAMPRNWPMAPSALDHRLAFEDFTIREVKSAGAGVTGALRFLIAFPDGETLKVKWKRFPEKTLDGWNNSPRKEVAAYRVQRWLFDEQDYVVPTPVPRCIPLDVYAPVAAHAKPSMPGTSCVLGLLVVWMNDVKVVGDLDKDIEDRFAKDPHFAQHLSDMNLLTYLIDHRDGREGNFMMSTDPTDPRVFSIDNGISFEGFPWDFFVPNWNRLRVPWLRREPIERLRTLSPEEIDRTATFFDMEVDAAGVLRLKQPTAPLDPKKGARIGEGRVQLGLTAKEIAALKERIHELLVDVDTGKIQIH